jgi:hypothetical protein
MDPLVVLAAVTVAFLVVIVPGFLFWQARMSPRARMRHRVEALGQMVAARAPGQENDAGERRRLIQGKLKELERQRRKDRRDTVRHLTFRRACPLPYAVSRRPAPPAVWRPRVCWRWPAWERPGGFKFRNEHHLCSESRRGGCNGNDGS